MYCKQQIFIYTILMFPEEIKTKQSKKYEKQKIQEFGFENL